LARINVERRAEIGRQKSARTKMLILDAARTLYKTGPRTVLTVDAIVEQAGLSKGAFYYHFEDIVAVLAAISDDLTRDLDVLFEPLRMAQTRGLPRVGQGFHAFLVKVALDPEWGLIVARHADDALPFGDAVRSGLVGDLGDARRDGELGLLDVDLAADIVIAFWVRTALRISAAPDKGALIVDATAALLRALGKTPAAASRLARSFAYASVSDALFAKEHR
jgi:AcrR family transcriptional regulator